MVLAAKLVFLGNTEGVIAAFLEKRKNILFKKGKRVDKNEPTEGYVTRPSN